MVVSSANLNDIGIVLGDTAVSEEGVQEGAENAFLWSSCVQRQCGGDVGFAC